jgi:hypothetical protein
MGACRRPPTTTPPTTAPTTEQPGTTAKPPTSPTTARPPSGGTQTVTSTIKLTSNFDGGGRTYKGGGDLGSGGDGEGKKAIFDVAPGVKVSNLTIGVPGSDGIHCLGSCTLVNITWTDVLDDAATLLGTNANDKMEIIGGRASNASDKVFQHNGPGTVVITGGFTVSNFGKLYRSCGNCSNNNTVRGQGSRHVVIDNVVVIGPGKTLAGINSNFGDTAVIKNVTIRNDSSKKIALCERYTGNSSGDEPSKNGSGAGGGCSIPGPVIYQ